MAAPPEETTTQFEHAVHAFFSCIEGFDTYVPWKRFYSTLCDPPSKKALFDLNAQVWEAIDQWRHGERQRGQTPANPHRNAFKIKVVLLRGVMLLFCQDDVPYYYAMAPLGINFTRFSRVLQDKKKYQEKYTSVDTFGKALRSVAFAITPVHFHRSRFQSKYLAFLCRDYALSMPEAYTTQLPISLAQIQYGDNVVRNLPAIVKVVESCFFDMGVTHPHNLILALSAHCKTFSELNACCAWFAEMQTRYAALTLEEHALETIRRRIGNNNIPPPTGLCWILQEKVDAYTGADKMFYLEALFAKE